MGETFADMVAKYGLLTALTAFAATYLVPRFFRARTEIAGANLQTADLHARTDIIEALQARMNTLEVEQEKLRAELNTERDKRTEAEDLVDTLSRRADALAQRVAQLEAQIRRLGHEPL